jgi:hypothetical protein
LIPDRIKLEFERTISALHVDDRFVAVGHVDGGISICDRVIGALLSLTAAPTTGKSNNNLSGIKSMLNNKSMIVWMGRFGDYLYAASPIGMLENG